MTSPMFLVAVTLLSGAFLASASARPWDDDAMRGFVDAFNAAAPATRPPPPRFRQYDRYLANSSLVGRRVACNARQKECLARSELWDAGSSRCVRLGEEAAARESDTERCRYALDTDTLRAGQGVLATCVPLRTRRCLWGYTMAYDNRCIDGFTLFAKVCAQTRDLEPGFHAGGGIECLCAGGACDFVDYETASDEEYGTMADDDEEEAEDVEDEEALLLWCHLPPLHAVLVPPTEAPVAAEDFRYHFDHSHEREH